MHRPLSPRLAAAIALLSLALGACGDDDKKPADAAGDSAETTVGTVAITAPESGAVVRAGRPLTLSGHWDGPAGARAAWSSSLDGALAEAPFDEAGDVQTPIDGLTEGSHVLTLAAMVDGVKVAEASIPVVATAASGGPLTVTIDPPGATTLDTLEAHAAGADGAVTWSWTRDDQPTGIATATVAAGTAKKHETWAATARDVDGSTGSAAVVIANVPPQGGVATLTPSEPTNGDLLTCETAGVVDADGDPLTWTYVWTVDGAARPETGATLDPAELVKGQVVRCAATASDGEATTAPMTAEATIAATLPRVAGAAVQPAPGPVCPSFACVTTGVSPSDAVVTGLAVRWEVDAAPWEPGEPIADGASVRCFARASDGSTRSDSGSLRFGPEVASPALVVVDDDPVLTAVGVLPHAPVVGDTLACHAAASDAECPDVELAYRWLATASGAVLGTGPTLATAGLAEGQAIACEVTASAGAGATTATSTAVALGVLAASAHRVEVVAPHGADGPITCAAVDHTVVFPAGMTATWDFWVGATLAQSGASDTLTAAVYDCSRVSCRLTLTPAAGPAVASNVAELLLPSGPDCADKNPCTVDACAPDGGCLALAAGLACSDGSLCTRADACVAGACAGVALDCDDDDPCTADVCDPAEGCAHLPASGGACDDGKACTSGDTCRAGACLGQSACGCDDAGDCDDGNPCTTDTCGAGGQCAYAAAGAIACDDRDGCTSGDACAGTTCQGTPVGTCTPVWFDGDHDGYGVGPSACACAVGGDWTAARGDDCNDHDADIHPGSTVATPGVDGDCDGWVRLADGRDVPTSSVLVVDPAAHCTPVAPPLGWSLAPLGPSEATFADCGSYYDVKARGTIPGLGASWTGTGHMSRDAKVATLDLALTSTWRAVAAEDYAPGLMGWRGAGLYQRGVDGTSVGLVAEGLCTADCCTPRATGGCSDPVTDDCVVGKRATCGNTWDETCVELAIGCAASMADGFELAGGHVETSWDGEWHPRVTGTMSFYDDQEEEVIGLEGCQDFEVRQCACRENEGCCDPYGWDTACDEIAESTCGDASGARCAGLFFMVGQVPDYQPLPSLEDNVFWFRDAVVQLALFPAAVGGTAMRGEEQAHGRAEVCIWPNDAYTFEHTGKPCHDGSLWSLDGLAIWKGKLDFLLRARAEAGLIPFYDDSYTVALTISSALRPVTDLFGTPDDPTDDVTIAKGVQTAGRYEIPWAIPDVLSGEGRLLDEVIGVWNWSYSLGGFEARLRAKVPVDVDVLPRNLVPGIDRLTFSDIEWQGLVTAQSPILEALGRIASSIKASFASKKSETASAASGSSKASNNKEAGLFTASLAMHSKAMLQPVSPSCEPWNKGYAADEHGHYCPGDQPTSAVWYFDAQQMKCVHDVPPKVVPTNLKDEPLCTESGCGTCDVDLACGAPWSLRCDGGQCVCRNKPSEAIYATEEACRTACPAHPPLWGNSNYQLAVNADGSVVARGDVYIDGHWIEPLGIPDIALENPGLSLGVNFTTVVPTFGFNGDIYYRPSSIGGGPECPWPTDDPLCTSLHTVATCDPAAPACGEAETCVCRGEAPCEVGVCKPNVCLGETFEGDNCLIHGGLSFFFGTPLSLIYRVDLDNLSIGNMLRILGGGASSIAGIFGRDLNPDLVSSLRQADADLRAVLGEAAEHPKGEWIEDILDQLAEVEAMGGDPWSWADAVRFEHLEFQVSTVVGQMWGQSFGVGVNGRAELVVTNPIDDTDPEYRLGLETRLNLFGEHKGFRLWGYGDPPPPALTAFIADKVPGLGRLRITGNPYAQEARLGDEAEGLTVDAPLGAYLSFAPTGEGTAELWFTSRPLGSFTSAGIMNGNDNHDAEAWWASLVTDPDDPGHARIEAGYTSAVLTCAPGGFICTLQLVPHVQRTVAAVVEDGHRHHLALVFHDGSIDVVLDGVERATELAYGEPTLPPPGVVSHLGVGGGIATADDVRLWRRVRSTDEIATEAQVLPPGSAKDADLIGRWDMDFDGDKDASGQVILHNGRYYTGAKLDGVYADGAVPADWDEPIFFDLSLGTSDHGTGFHASGGLALDDADGHPIVGFRGGAAFGTTPAGDEQAALDFYMTPITLPRGANHQLPDSAFRWGYYQLTGDGPNGVSFDYDDGIYLGADFIDPYVEGSARLTYFPPSGEPKAILGWSVSYDCPDDLPGCDDSEKELAFGGPMTLDHEIGDATVVRLEGTGHATLGGFEVSGGVVVGKRKADGTVESPKVEVTSTRVYVDERYFKFAAQAKDLKALGGVFDKLDFGAAAVGLEIDTEDKTVCATLDTRGDGDSNTLDCKLRACFPLSDLTRSTLDLDCGGLCSSDDYCGEGQACILGLCHGTLADGVPCYSNEICSSRHCGSIVPDADCVDQVNQVTTACIGVCYTPATSELGQVCWDPLQCKKGDCKPAVSLGSLFELDTCQCGPGDCAAGEFCGILDGKCHAKKPSGNRLLESACVRDEECQSGRCLAGLCACQDGACGAGEFCATLDRVLAFSNVCEPERGRLDQCNSDVACASGDCVATRCAECGPAAGCASSEYCSALGLCVKKLLADALCDRDDQCDSGKCRNVGATDIKHCVECETSAQCGAGRYCSPLLGRCEDKRVGGFPCACPGSTSCNPDEQCRSGDCSAAGFCTCTTDAHCASAAFCNDDHRCQPDFPLTFECERDAQCLKNHCDDSNGGTGHCVACETDSQCASDSFCANTGEVGSCLPDLLPYVPCTRNAQCHSNSCTTISTDPPAGLPVIHYQGCAP